MTKKSLVVIGGGPGGYVAAIRAAQLGAQVTLIEKDALGGTCLNRGCIPTKALLESSNLFATIKEASTFGICIKDVSLDLKTLTKRKEGIVKRLVSGVESLLRNSHIRVVKGSGMLINSHTLGIVGKDEQIKAEGIIIATGSESAKVRIPGIGEPGVITSDEALTMAELPQSMVIIEGGVIGLEFAQIFHRIGAEVTVLELMPQILPGMDAEIARILAGVLFKDGIEIITSATVTEIKSVAGGKRRVSFATDGVSREKEVEKVMIAVGRQPFSSSLGLETLGISVDSGRVQVNERMETSIGHIYAVGDVIGGTMLAHVAMAEGRCAAENAMGSDCKMDYCGVPFCIYTSPQVATVGLTEDTARQKYDRIQVSRFPFIASGRAQILGRTDGMVKVAAEGKYGEILGVHVIGPEATELIAEAVLAMQLEATAKDFAYALHAHPTLSEAVAEAIWGLDGKAIHY